MAPSFDSNDGALNLSLKPVERHETEKYKQNSNVETDTGKFKYNSTSQTDQISLAGMSQKEIFEFLNRGCRTNPTNVEKQTAEYSAHQHRSPPVKRKFTETTSAKEYKRLKTSQEPQTNQYNQYIPQSYGIPVLDPNQQLLQNATYIAQYNKICATLMQQYNTPLYETIWRNLSSQCANTVTNNIETCLPPTEQNMTPLYQKMSDNNRATSTGSGESSSPRSNHKFAPVSLNGTQPSTSSRSNSPQSIESEGDDYNNDIIREKFEQLSRQFDQEDRDYLLNTAGMVRTRIRPSIDYDSPAEAARYKSEEEKNKRMKNNEAAKKSRESKKSQNEMILRERDFYKRELKKSYSSNLLVTQELERMKRIYL